MCSYALVANAPAVIVQYGQMLLAMTPDDAKLLNYLSMHWCGKTTRQAEALPLTTPRDSSRSPRLNVIER